MPPVILLQTPIPGPKSQALTARRAKAVPRGVPSTTPLAVVHAENAVVTDADGNRLIDFGGGIGVVNAGHRNPRVVEAVRKQLDHFTHVCFPVSTYEPYVELAERLNALTPGTHEKRTFFVNSGAEAVENAVKAARHFTGRQAVVCFEHGFHGRTYLGMALTSKVMPYKKGFGPFAPEVYRLPFPYCYRCPNSGGSGGKGGSAGSCCMADREDLERQLDEISDRDDDGTKRAELRGNLEALARDQNADAIRLCGKVGSNHRRPDVTAPAPARRAGGYPCCGRPRETRSSP